MIVRPSRRTAPISLSIWRRCSSNRRGRRGAAATILLLTLSPIAIVLVATILKDSLFAGALLMAAGLLTEERLGELFGGEIRLTERGGYWNAW